MKTPTFGEPASTAMSAQPGGPWSVRLGAYACFFLTGATSLVFEVLWSNQFVTVFGNSSYAVSVVLCAYMAGLGLGGLVGGKMADRVQRPMSVFGLIQLGVAGWALAIPRILEMLRGLVPALAALSPESLLGSTVTRFALAFAILAVPCFLMGTTLPLLARAVTDSSRQISRRIGALYCWNTLGAASGCLVTGFWMLDTLGLRMTNFFAVGVNLLIGLASLIVARGAVPVNRPERKDLGIESAGSSVNREEEEGVPIPGSMLLGIAFVNGLGGLACEVLWFRYLAFLLFLGRPAYVFPTILGIYLLGLGLGGLIYRLVVARMRGSAKTLCVIQVLLALSVLGTFSVSATVFASGPPPPLGITSMALVTVSLPAVLMGIAFPLLCQLYGRRLENLGQRVGLLFAVNTAGTVLGSLLPVFVLVPLLGIQKSLLLTSVLFGGMGLGVWYRLSHRRFFLGMAGIYAAAVLSFVALVPSDLCQQVFLAMGFNLAKHTDILFYDEGRTGTAIVTRDRASGHKLLYVNGNPEAPALYGHQLCFKLLGDLGPLLHPNPDNVLMICFGGGIAAGATECLPAVKSLTVVDLEGSVIDAAGVLAEENNRVLQNPKTHVVIDDGRNYIATTSRRWPVIITDSTHPKAPDSWVLYSQEFYRQVRDRLTDDGVFVQWVPHHDLSTDEYKIIVRTFQSVFPHASLWVSAGMDERGQFITYTLLVSTARPLGIDVSRLRERLGAPGVRADLEPYGLHTPAGLLDTFLCGEDRLRRWVGTGPVNTDDLPYTYYITRYAKGDKMGYGAFMELMEDIWPRLTGTGAETAGRQLQSELALRAKMSRLAFSGRLPEAYDMLPADARYRRMRQLYNEGPAYVNALAATFWDDPAGLVYAAGLGAPGQATFANAEHIYERVLKIDPDNVEALNMLGCMRSEKGDLSGAEECLDRAVELEPASAHVQYNVATLLFRKGKTNEAIAHYRKALKIDPDYADALVNLGTAFLNTGALDEAVGCYRRALKLRPDSADTSYNLALALTRKGQVGEAVGFYQKALEIKSDEPGTLNDLAWVLATSVQPSVRNGKRAVELAEKANTLTGGEVPPVLHTLAAAYAEAGRFGDAIRSLQKAIDLAHGAGQPELMDKLDNEMRLFEAGRPIRE